MTEALQVACNKGSLTLKRVRFTRGGGGVSYPAVGQSPPRARLMWPSLLFSDQTQEEGLVCMGEFGACSAFGPDIHVYLSSSSERLGGELLA